MSENLTVPTATSGVVTTTVAGAEANDYDPAVSHGHSPAAWTAVIIMLIAFTAGTVCYVSDFPAGVIASAILLLLGLLTGWVLAKLGYGVRGLKYQPKGH